MCTLILMHHVVPSMPLLVLANRDEMIDRPSRAPSLLRRNPAVFCGRDEKEGGTWCGINEHGVFVGLTNLTLRAPEPGRRSRGLLCTDMLLCVTAAEAEQAARHLQAQLYNPFNLVVSDGVHAFRVQYDDETTVELLAPGIYATTNWPRGRDGDAKRERSEERVAAAIQGSVEVSSLVVALQNLARTHERNGDPRASLCCHAHGYGTRCSSIIGRGVNGQTMFVHADGSPCTTPYEDLGARVAEAFGV